MKRRLARADSRFMQGLGSAASLFGNPMGVMPGVGKAS
jgi:hypothetical protein